MKRINSVIASLILIALMLGGVGVKSVAAASAQERAAAAIPNGQQAYLKASNTAGSDGLGYAIAMSGETVVIGAPGKNSNAGAVYVFVRSGTTWTQQANLTASNAAAGDGFGKAVAISGDTLVVGAPSQAGSGAIYIFVRSAGVWTQQPFLKASNADSGDNFGAAVAIDGGTLVVGAPAEDSNSTVINSGMTNNAADAAGAAYVFTRSATTQVWSEQTYLKAGNAGLGDSFGSSVAVVGTTVAVGAPKESGNLDAVSQAGAAYVYTYSLSGWTQQAILRAPNTNAGDNFGAALSLSGESLLIGAPLEDSAATGVNGSQTDNTATDSGAAYVFVRSAGAWSHQAYLKASNTGLGDEFGTSVSLSTDLAVIGASKEDSGSTRINSYQGNNSASESGAAYIFTRTAPNWTINSYLKASNAEGSDMFGVSVAAGGSTVVAGASQEDSSATTINGNGADNTAGNAGAAYVFVPDNTAPAAPVINSPANGSILNDLTPTISGTAEALANIFLYVQGPTDNKSASPVAFGSTVTDAAGNWSFTPVANMANGGYSVYVTATDPAGNLSANSATKTFTLDAVAPTAPIISAPANGQHTKQVKPGFAGKAEAGSTVKAYLDGAGSPAFTVTADGSGNWSYTPDGSFPSLSDGPHTVKATATDSATNTSAFSAINTFTVDTAAPAAPVLITPANNSTTGDQTPTISGTAEANSVITIYHIFTLDEQADGMRGATTVTNNAGAWSYTPTVIMEKGVHGLYVTATDAAGNTSAVSNTNSFTIQDITAPAAPVVSQPANGQAINDNTPLIKGSAEAGSTVKVYINNTLKGSVLSNQAGAWAFTQAAALADGTYTVHATATDPSNNVSPASAQNTFKVDTVAPNTTISASSAPKITTATSASFTFGSTEAGTFECKLDGGAFAACTSPKAYTNLPAGKHTFLVRAKDTAKNIDATPAGYAWLIQAERIINGDFESYASPENLIPLNWTAADFDGVEDGKSTSNVKSGNVALHMIGAKSTVKTLTQEIALTGVTGDILTFSVWISGSGIPETGFCQANVKLMNGATVVDSKTIQCAPGIYNYQNKKITFKASGNFTDAVVKFLYSNTVGGVWFDMASLLK